MKNFMFGIIGKKNDDGSGSVSWHHATDTATFGDHVELENFDDEWMDAVREIAVQAAYTLDTIYGLPEQINEEIKANHEKGETQ